MDRWIRRGYYPSWILRLFRHGKGRCEDRAVNEHLVVEGKTGKLQNDFMHEDRKGVTDWNRQTQRLRHSGGTGTSEYALRARLSGN